MTGLRRKVLFNWQDFVTVSGAVITIGVGKRSLFRASLKRIYNDLERTDDTVSH